MSDAIQCDRCNKCEPVAIGQISLEVYEVTSIEDGIEQSSYEIDFCLECSKEAQKVFAK